MSSFMLQNFDWTLCDVTPSVLAKTLSAASHPYRLVENNRLVCFNILTKEDVDDAPCINVEGLSPSRLKIFLAKYLVLGWLYIDTATETHPPFVLSRLTAYVRYYKAILEELRVGKLEIFERWWKAECKYEFCQHSSRGVARTEGPLEESLVFEENDIEWGMDEVLKAENLALVSEDQLKEAAPYVGDWIKYEVEREVGKDLDGIDELMSQDSEDDEEQDGEPAAAKDAADAAAAAAEDAVDADTDMVVEQVEVEEDTGGVETGTVTDLGNNMGRGRYNLRKAKKRATADPNQKRLRPAADKDEAAAADEGPDEASGGEAEKPVAKVNFRFIKGKEKETADSNSKRSKKVGIKRGRKKANFDPVEEIPGISDPGNESIEHSSNQKKLIDLGRTIREYF